MKKTCSKYISTSQGWSIKISAFWRVYFPAFYFSNNIKLNLFFFDVRVYNFHLIKEYFYCLYFFFIIFKEQESVKLIEGNEGIKMEKESKKELRNFDRYTSF